MGSCSNSNLKLLNGVVHSPYSDIELPSEALHFTLFRKYLQYSNKVAILEAVSGKEYTFRQLVDIARRVGSGLAKIGVKKGDVVSLYSYNTPEWLFMFYGVLYAGGTVTTVNPSYTKCELSWITFELCIFCLFDGFSKVQMNWKVISRTPDASLFSQKNLCFGLARNQ